MAGSLIVDIKWLKPLHVLGCNSIMGPAFITVNVLISAAAVLNKTQQALGANKNIIITFSLPFLQQKTQNKPRYVSKPTRFLHRQPQCWFYFQSRFNLTLQT